MRQFWLVGGTCLLLAGCMTPQMRAAQDDRLCREAGAGPETGDYAECRQFAIALRAQRDAAQAAAFGNLANIGLGIMRASQPPQPVIPRSFDCSVGRSYGGSRQVSCQ